MSLILDALKKSEQERRRDKGPDLQTIHQPPLIRAPRHSYRALWIALLLGVNAAVLAFWWQQRGAAPAPATATPIVAAQATAPTTTNITTATPAAPVTVSTPEENNAAPVASEQKTPHIAPAEAEYTRITPATSVPQPAIAAPSARIEEVDELPEDVRNNLPAMTFSFHVYSSNPQQRTIIINNRRMREGDEVSAGLLLQEITEDGVVLSYAQHRIHISVLSGW